MSQLLKNKSFYLGFVVGILIMFALNLYTVYRMKGCHHCNYFFGYPLTFYSGIITECVIGNAGFICNVWEFSWFGAIVDVLTAVIFSFVVGLIFKFVWGKFTMKRLK